MIINRKSVEVLLRSSIEHNISDFNQEVDFLLKKAEKSGKGLKDIQEIKNKMLYYFDNLKGEKKSVSQSSSVLIDIDSNDLYEVYRPEEISYIDLVYGSETSRKFEIVTENWLHRSKLLDNNIGLINNILLYGEPGTGKTQIVMNLAKKLNLPLVLVRLDEIISSYLGKTGKNIKEIFDIVAKHKCILFFDELDAIGKKRDDNQELGELKRVVTVFLQNLDTVKHKGFIVGATNHPELIDKALWRRFDIYIETHYPQKEEIENIFNTYLNEKVKVTLKKDKIKIGKFISNISGGHIKKMCDHINRTCIISNNYDIVSILKAFVESINDNIYSKIKLSDKYEIAKKLNDNKITVKKVSEIMNIPYTTLRDNILVK